MSLFVSAANVHADEALDGETLVGIKQMSPAIALRAAQAALRDCRQRGFQVSIAVTDRWGQLQVLLRDRFAGVHTIGVATDKAWTAASFKVDTESLKKLSLPGGPADGLRHMSRVVAVGGGRPIEAAGSLVGAIGVSGAPGGGADDACAKAGIAAVSLDLSF